MGVQVRTHQTPSVEVCDNLNKNGAEAHFRPGEGVLIRTSTGKKAVREDKCLSSGFGKKCPYVYKTEITYSWKFSP